MLCDNGTRSSKPARVDAAVFAAIVLSAFALRLIYVLQLRHSPLFDSPIMDELYHDQWGRAIAAGTRFVDGPYFRAPLYPSFLGAVYKVFGPGYLAPRILQGILGSLSCGLVFLIGRDVFDRRIAAVAGFAAAGYWILIYFDGELLIPTLIVWLDLLMIRQLLRAARRPSVTAYGSAGVLLGLSAIARPNVLLFAPAVVVWLVIRSRAQRSRTLKYAVGYGIGCLLPVLPVTVRNYVIGNDTVLIASQGGVNFYIGNNPSSNGRTAIVPGTPGTWWGGYHATIRRAEQARGRPLKPSEVSRYYFAQAWDFIIDQPGRFVALTARKLGYFWTRREISNNKSIRFWTERFTPIVRWLPLGFALVAPFGLVGLVLCLRRAGQLFPLWGFVVVYMVSVVMFFCNARYRTPILGPLILLAAYGLFWCAGSIKRTGWKGLLRVTVLLAPAALWVNIDLHPGQSTGEHLSHYTLANAYRRQGDLVPAAESYHEVLRIVPGYLTARYELATILDSLGRTSEAIHHFRLAVRTPVEPALGEGPALAASAHTGLGIALVRCDEDDEAIEHFRKAIELDPDAPDALPRLHLASLLVTLGREGEAIEVCLDALRGNPDLRDAHYHVAGLLAKTGRLDAAAHHLREALRINPDDADALVGLAGVFLEQDRLTESIDLLRQAVRIAPGDGGIVMALGDALAGTARYTEALDVLRQGLHLGDPALLDQLAWLLATCPAKDVRDGAQALAYARRLCPDTERCHPVFLDTYAAALAQDGQFNEAARVARHALDLARRHASQVDPGLPGEIAARLELYEADLPYYQQTPAPGR